MLLRARRACRTPVAPCGCALLCAALCLSLPAGDAAAQMYVHVDEDGTVHVSDRRSDARQVPYAPGDFERWALAQGGTPHAGLLAEQRRKAAQTAPSTWDALIRAASERYGVRFPLLKAVIAVESAFNPHAVSRAGAQGMMQLMPATAAELGVSDPFDAAQNIDGGARYLAALLRAFSDEKLALAAYNAGPSRVRKLGRVPDFPETRAYVKNVRSLAERYAREG